MLTNAELAELISIAKRDVSGEERDSHGRWSAGTQGEQAAGAAHQAMRAVGPAHASVRDTFRAAATAAHMYATKLASGIGHIISSTRLTAVNPTKAGGVQLSFRHKTAGAKGPNGIKPATINSTVQINPHHTANFPVAAAALGYAHRAVARMPAVPVAPAVQATFSRRSD